MKMVIFKQNVNDKKSVIYYIDSKVYVDCEI